MATSIEEPGRSSGSRTAWIAVLLAVTALALAAFTRPDLENRTEARFYLDSARAISAPDRAMDHRREPGYPAFLSLLIDAGLEPVTWAPVTQTAVFLASLLLLLCAAAGRAVPLAALAAVAAAVACVPTFLITVNGALLTESISASAVLLLLAALVQLWRAVAEEPRALAAAGWLALALASSVFLGLTKGSFSFVALAFLPLAAGSVVLVAGRPRRRQLVYLALVAVTCVMPHVAVKAWLHPTGLPRFQRAGQILYGRTVYASRFDFRRDTLPYLVAALSERGCQRIYGERCLRYRFDAENRIGEELSEAGVSDQELWQRGWQVARTSPVRTLLLAPLELARFAVHHTTRGFAALDVPVLGPISRSAVTIALLKLLNALVYVVPLACLAVLHRNGGVRTAWAALPARARVATVLAVAYGVAYLAVHGMATAILRMVYPIAVLPLLLAIGAVAVTVTVVGDRYRQPCR